MRMAVDGMCDGDFHGFMKEYMENYPNGQAMAQQILRDLQSTARTPAGVSQQKSARKLQLFQRKIGEPTTIP